MQYTCQREFKADFHSEMFTSYWLEWVVDKPIHLFHLVIFVTKNMASMQYSSRGTQTTSEGF